MQTIESHILAILQLIFCIIALLMCLWMFPYFLVTKRPRQWTRLQRFQMLTMSSLLLLEMAQLIEVSLHLYYISRHQDSITRPRTLIVNPILKYVGIPLFIFMGIHLVFFSGTKFHTIAMPSYSSNNSSGACRQPRHHVYWLGYAHILNMLLGGWTLVSVLLTDWVSEDFIRIHRITSSFSFCFMIALVTAILEIYMCHIVFQNTHVIPFPTRKDYQHLLTMVSVKVKWILGIWIVILVLLADFSLGLYLWCELVDKGTTYNYHVNMSHSLAAIVICQVHWSAALFHTFLNTIKNTMKHVKTNNASSATPSELKSILSHPMDSLKTALKDAEARDCPPLDVMSRKGASFK